jgi:hypothetical protein
MICSKQFRFFVLILVAMVLPSLAIAQTSTGITGRVTDQTGAVIQKAIVIAHNELTNEDLTTVSTSTGDFSFPGLKPGLYDVSATAPGFDTAKEVAIHLELDATVTVKLALKPGAAKESVVVKADEIQLDQARADRGVVFSQDELEQAPLNSGNPLLLANTEPGVYFNGCVSCGWVRPFDNGAINQFSNNGQGSDTNDFQFDGSPDNANSFGLRDIGYVPPTASIQEMKFISNPYDAQYGHTGGGVFDIVSKYGTNNLHGQVYENARRTALDANSHYNDNPVIDLPKTSDVRNQYGFEVDGPLVIPHFYNGRNKAFFEAQLEIYSMNTPLSGIDTVPALSPGSTTQTVAQTGDFSQDYYWNGTANAPITIYDPLTENTAGGCDCRQPFPNNQIPTTRLNSTAEAILSYLPLPNRPTPAMESLGTDDYAWQATGTDRFKNVVARIDQTFSDKDKAYIRFAWDKRVQNYGDPGEYNGIAGPGESGVFPLVRQNHFFTTDWTHTFNSNSLFDLHASFTRYAYAQNQGYSPFDLSKIGLGSLTLPGITPTFPQIDMNGYTVFGNNANNGGTKVTITDTIAAMPMWTYVHGAHTIKAGLDYRWMRASNYTAGTSSGYFYVDSEWTQQYSWGWTGPQGGDSVASMVLGTMDAPGQNGQTSNINIAPNQFFSYPYFAPFVQDDWKVNRKLTLNLGVRWDLQGPPSEANNKMVGAFNTTSPNPVISQLTSPLPGGMTLVGGNTYAGVNGQPRTLFNWSLLALQPRVGFAYSLDQKTVIRGGIGSSYVQFPGQGFSQGFSQSTAYDASNSNGLFPDGNSLTNPFPTIAQPAGASLGLLNSLGDSFGVSNRYFKLPGVVNYSFGAERQVTNHMTVDLSYVGSSGFHLDSSDNINHISEAFAASCNLEMGATPATYQNCISAPSAATASNPEWVTNPFLNAPAFSTAATGNGNGYYTNPVLSASIYTTPYPQFGAITQTEQNRGETQFNSLQAVVIHRWSNAFTAHGSFVWAKTIDSGYWNDEVYRIPQHYLDLGNRKWRFTANTDWHIPVGKGRALLGNADRLVDSLAGGWIMGTTYYYEAGTAVGVPSSLEIVHTQHYGIHRTVEAGVPLIRQSTNCVGWYDPTPSNGDPAYTLEPEQGTNTTNCTAETTAPHAVSSYDYIVQPGYAANENVPEPGVFNPRGQQLDVSLSKSVPIRERMSFEFRAEAYNLPNHPSWQGFGSWWDPTDPHFGTINMIYNGQTNIPRNIQLSAKILW